MWYNGSMRTRAFPLSTTALAVAGISLFVGVIALPGSDLSAVFRAQPDAGYSLEELQAHRGDWREQRRLYSRAIEACRDRRQQGQVLDCTTIKFNDPTTFVPFLTEAVPSIVPSGEVSHTAAPELTVQALSEQDRSTLRRYQRGGSCPATLKDYLPGFYELCQRVVQETQLPLSRGRMDVAAKKRIPAAPVPKRLTADDIAKAKKRPVPAARVRPRHTEGRFSSSAASQE